MTAARVVLRITRLLEKRYRDDDIYNLDAATFVLVAYAAWAYAYILPRFAVTSERANATIDDVVRNGARDPATLFSWRYFVEQYGSYTAAECEARIARAMTAEAIARALLVRYTAHALLRSRALDRASYARACRSIH